MQAAHLLGEVPGDRGQQLFLRRVGADVRQLVKATVSSQRGCVQPLQVDTAHCCLPLRYSPLQVVLIRICLKRDHFSQTNSSSSRTAQHTQWHGSCVKELFLQLNNRIDSPTDSGSDGRAGRRGLAGRCCASPACAQRRALHWAE